MKKMYYILIMVITTSHLLFWEGSLNAQEYRTFDGYGNNIANPNWGAAGTNQLQITPIGFSDGISEPGGQNRPNPRIISNAIFNQEVSLPDATELSDYAWVWGQFIDHDITASPDDPDQPLNIQVPMGDNYFDPNGSGNVFINMNRSLFDPSTGTSITNPRAFPNAITAFIDGSGVYGSDREKADWLRSFEDGKLKTSIGNRLPYNTISGNYDDEIDIDAPFMAMANPFINKWFVAGDFRANENVLLCSMHTIFMREHNRICDELKLSEPSWDDERIYQKARKTVGALIQTIVYEEWLPTLGVILEDYSAYDDSVNPGIMNIFSTSAYRYGHTVINSRIIRMDNSGNIIPEGNITLKEAFFNPQTFVEGGGVNPLLKGMATQIEQEFDTKMIHDLRNFLFGPPGAGGLDLASLNINRGRERGLTNYNLARVSFGLPLIERFEDLSDNQELNTIMEQLYGDINNIDSWVGFLAEDHMPNTLFGESVLYIMKEQFTNLRDGDRYFYENDEFFSDVEKEEIRNTRLVDIINRNSEVEFMQDNVFLAQQHTSISDISETSLAMTVYPNPSSETFFINVTDVNKGEAFLQVTDLFGKFVVQKKIMLTQGTTNFEVNIPNTVQTGIYILTLAAQNESGSTKLFKI